MPHRDDDSGPLAAPSLLYAVKQVELAVRSHLDAVLRPAGITTAQYTALTVLQRGHDVTAAQLARNSFVTTQSMADLVGALERQGLISRERDSADRRRVTLSLTPQGQRLLDEHATPVAALEATMVAHLTPAQASDLGTALNSCRAALAEASST
ncbi:MarR family winged helix-turn-helix transcriptional regulator, partial [Aeromicrobium sp. CF3.5]|uniref:MarR family winged helix-turn-helix transcriptional regulator n=1 Tax=Aeromicrobium sp. CF3.5 TaxID=3373078 RepID=UPI003EE57E85